MRQFLPGYYITEDGEVYSDYVKRYLKPHINHKGYRYVEVYVDGKRHMYRICRLVAEAYIPNPDKLPQVNHKDTNKLNDKSYNLEWVTNTDNMIHAYSNGRKPTYGNSRPVLQLTIDGQQIAEFRSMKSASNTLGISLTNIHSVCNGNRNTAGGYKWVYKELLNDD